MPELESSQEESPVSPETLELAERLNLEFQYEEHDLRKILIFTLRERERRDQIEKS